MSVDICSRIAYRELLESGYFGDRKAEILSLFMEYGSLTGEECASLVESEWKRSCKSETVRNRICAFLSPK